MVMIYRRDSDRSVDVDETEARIEVARGNARYDLVPVRLRVHWDACNPGEVIGVTSDVLPGLLARGVVERYVTKGESLDYSAETPANIDVSDDPDPDDRPSFAPIKRGRGRPRKAF
jgi:hypothetical protein